MPTYNLELRDSNDNLLRYIRNWFQGRVVEQINEPERLHVGVVLDGDIDQYLIPANRIWVSNDKGEILFKTFISSVVEHRVDQNMAQIEAMGAMSQLSTVWIDTYDSEGEKSIEDIVEDLLGFQSGSFQVSLETIEVERDLEFQVNRATLIQAIRHLQNIVGGEIRVDSDLDMYWVDSIGSWKGQQIRTGKNLRSFRKRVNTYDMVNRLYGYGSGFGEDALRLPDPGYVEDTDSISAYGPHVGSFTDQRFIHEESLVEYANRLLERRKHPEIVYEVSAIDLSTLFGDEYTFESWELGNTMAIVDPSSDMYVKVRIGQIEWDLANPGSTNIHLNEPRRNFASLEMDERQQRANSQSHDPLVRSLQDGGTFDTDILDPLWGAIGDIESDVDDHDGLIGDLQHDMDALRSSLGGSESEADWLTRTFVGSTLQAINDLEESQDYPELTFRDGDRALTNEPALYVRKNGVWIQVWKPVIEVDTYLQLANMDPQPPSGTIAVLTQEGGYPYIRRGSSWRPMQPFDDAGGIPMQGWAVGDLYKGSDGVVSVIEDDEGTPKTVPISHFES